MKAIFVIGDKLLDISQILSVTENFSELALILEYETTDNLVVAYFRSASDYQTNLELIRQEIQSRADPDVPPPTPVPIPTKPDTKITLQMLQEILKAYSPKSDIIFRNGATLPINCDFNALISTEDLHIVFPSIPSPYYVNAPSGWTSGIVLVGNIGGYTYNLAYSMDDNFYYRTHSPDTGWNPWNKQASYAEIMASVSQLITPIQTDVNNLKQLIPSQASSTNRLADKNFVNSSIGTNTANYIFKTVDDEKLPFDSVEELESYAGIVTNNDYAFVTGLDELGNTYFDRYKASVVDSVVTWAKEYRLNNSSFTAEQWAAINSGISQLEPNPEETGSEVALERLGINNINYKLAGGGSSAPIGSIQASSVDLSNDGYILCDGRAVSRTDYAELFAKYNAMTPPLPFGSGDGSTTFNIPNLSDKFIEGTGTNQLGTVKAAGLPNITGGIGALGGSEPKLGTPSGAFRAAATTDYYSQTTNYGTGYVRTDGFTLDASRSSSIYGKSDTVQPPSVCLYFFVKARNISQLEVQDAIDDTKTTASNVWSAEKVDEKFNDVGNELSTCMKKIVLTPRNIDFNSYTNEGIYYPYGDMNAGDWVGTTWTNAPVSKPQGGFSLTVIREGNYIRQVLFVYYDNHMYTRCQYYSAGVTWTSWRTI